MFEALTSYLYTWAALRDAKTNPPQPSHILPISEADDIYVRMGSTRKLFPPGSFHFLFGQGKHKPDEGSRKALANTVRGRLESKHPAYRL